MTHVERIDGKGQVPPPPVNPVRTAVRFPMRLPLTIQTRAGVLRATTENVSSNGLLFVSEQLPAVDSKIEFTMTMPSAIMGADKDVTVHCIGRIVRHEQEGREKKAAVVIDEYFLKA